MMEGLEQRELLSAAVDGVITSDPQAASDIVIAADAPQAPLAAPTGVNIIKTFSTSLIVGWIDQSASESGSRIERSTDGAAWATVGTVGPNVTSFQDNALLPATPYVYRVVAFDFLSEFASDPITATTSSQLLQLGYDSNGLSSIYYNGSTLLDTANTPTDHLTTSLHDGFSVFDYKILKWDGTTVVGNGAVGFTTSWDSDTHTLTYDYAWGRIVTQYTQDVDRLNLTITVTNKSTKNTLMGVTILPFIINFPSTPIGYSGSWQIGYNADGPTVVPADWQTGMVAATNDDVVRPLYVGFLTYPATTTDQKYLYWVGSKPYWCQTSNIPSFDRPIAPGASDQYTVSLRFAPSGTTTGEIAPDVYSSAAAQYPSEVNWADRRPIGIITVADSTIAGKSTKNPRGYLGGTFDVHTKTGRERFRKLLLHSADTSISVLQGMNAQGMVVWDLEGMQYTKINYVGDPRMLQTLAPEMEYRGAVDAYFKKFRDAGLRVGLTVRGQQLKLTSKGWKQMNVANPYALLAAKIAYARARWGISLFYVDTNVGKTIFDASVFKRLLETFPDVLLIPEHETTRYFAYGAPYQEVRFGEVSTPDSALQAYPTAFSAINATNGDLAANHDALVASVRRGDILLFRGWWNDPQNVAIKSIYDEAVSGT